MPKKVWGGISFHEKVTHGQHHAHFNNCLYTITSALQQKQFCISVVCVSYGFITSPKRAKITTKKEQNLCVENEEPIRIHVFQGDFLRSTFYF